HQTAADGKHLLLATRQGLGTLHAPLIKPRKYSVDALAILRTARAGAAIAAEIKIVAHRQVGKEPTAFRYVNEPARHNGGGPFVRQFVAVEANRPGPRA